MTAFIIHTGLQERYRLAFIRSALSICFDERERETEPHAVGFPLSGKRAASSINRSIMRTEVEWKSVCMSGDILALLLPLT